MLMKDLKRPDNYVIDCDVITYDVIKVNTSYYSIRNGRCFNSWSYCFAIHL